MRTSYDKIYTCVKINKGTAIHNGTQYPKSFPFLAKSTDALIKIPHPIAIIPAFNHPNDNLFANSVSAANARPAGDAILINDIK